MTWEQLKKKVEDAGVQDADTLDYMDIGTFADDGVEILLEVRSDGLRYFRVTD